ncbi:hypothetical protein [Spartinivicinus poritis]|uniref:Uncharacterized protein n=1 Tax=Spartinivicinus poritis TaxID=2994640 RepID=A0ABT5UHF4_9GAMM|nr:hypothetical protein [Spartinivicinus sp. A2-2]MDE1465834.1 hypothetical protein [Spartinivicinus sp. A2-2]
MEPKQSVFEERAHDGICEVPVVIAPPAFPLTPTLIGTGCIPADFYQRFSSVGQASEGG